MLACTVDPRIPTRWEACVATETERSGHSVDLMAACFAHLRPHPPADDSSETSSEESESEAEAVDVPR